MGKRKSVESYTTKDGRWTLRQMDDGNVLVYGPYRTVIASAYGGGSKRADGGVVAVDLREVADLGA